jgi:hypothetical protein
MSKKDHEIRKEAIAILNSMAKTNNGRIAAEDLVKAAEDPESPLHGYFDWDDASAAHQHRLEQARRLIASVKYEVVVNSHKICSPAYVRDTTVDKMEQGYIHIAKLRTDEDAARDTMLREFDRVKQALIRARKIGAVLDMLTDIDSMIDTLELVSTRAKDTGQQLPA